MSIPFCPPRCGRRVFQALVLTAFLGAALSIPAAAQSYQLVDLGMDVSPTDINNGGTIVGSRSTSAGNVAFVRSADGALTDIAGATRAYAVNDADAVVGTTPDGAFLLDGSMREWSGYGAFGINEIGQISGNVQLNNPYRPSPLPLDPALYTPNRWDNLGIATVYPRGTRQGVYADLYVLNGINDAGYTVGSRSRYGLTGSSAILITPEFRAVTYLSIPNGGRAAAINNQNLVVGVTGNNSSAGEYSHAFLLDYNTGGYTDLGTLNGGLTSSAADINDLNQVVGSSWLVTQLTSVYDPTLYHAFLWQNGAMADLNDSIDPQSGWLLTAATAINDNGDIVGTGILNGQTHGFLLLSGNTPPPPPPTNDPPVAVISADTTSGPAPLTVNFSSDGSYDLDGFIADYAWDFGDGSAVSHEVSPTHQFTQEGTYITILTATDDKGLTATAQQEIRVRKPHGGGKR